MPHLVQMIIQMIAQIIAMNRIVFLISYDFNVKIDIVYFIVIVTLQ